MIDAPAIPHGHCHTPACWRRVSERRHRGFWRHRFARRPAAWRRWARCIATFETWGTPWRKKASVDTGNGYYGSTQWLLSTALAAGFHPKPSRSHPTGATVTRTTLYEQLDRTVTWAQRAGKSQWSTSRSCG